MREELLTDKEIHFISAKDAKKLSDYKNVESEKVLEDIYKK